MAITTDFCTGFDHGLVSAGTGNTGLYGGITAPTATMSTLAARNGSHGARAQGNGASANQVQLSGTNGSKLVTVVAFRVTQLPAGAGTFSLQTWNTAQAPAIQMGNTGQMSAIIPTGTAVNGPQITDSNWHILECQLDVSTTAMTLDWKVDGTAQTQATFTAASATSAAQVWLGLHAAWSAGGAAPIIDFDDYVQGRYTGASPSATEWYGEHKVVPIRPGSDGTHVFVTGDFAKGDSAAGLASTTTDFWTMVDDPAPWASAHDIADSIAQIVVTGSNIAKYVEIKPAATPETGTATAVRTIEGYSSSATTANLMGCVIRNSAGAAVPVWGNINNASGGTGGTVSPYGNADYSETAHFFKWAFPTTPAAGWTPAEVNALHWRIGASTDIAPRPTVQMLMLEAAYPVAAAAATSLPPYRSPYRMGLLQR